MTAKNPGPDHRSSGTKPGVGGNGTTKQKIKEDARDVKREAGNKAREQAEAGQHQVADEADSLSDAIDAAASSLDDHDREGLAHYARELSSNLANAASQLEGRSIDELANDAKRLARTNPALFMLGSIGVGFGLSRFFKASAERGHNGAYRSNGASKDDTLQSGTGTPVKPHERNMKENTTSTPPRTGNGRDML